MKEPKKTISTGEKAYFVASNSKNGFCSYYRECFDRAEIGRLFAIKGGPGTGKSRLMRSVAEYAKTKGWEAEMIYCSSDPASLDGVILKKEKEEGIAILDATAPHLYEQTKPGYREELIDLGVFWSSDALREWSGELSALGRRKSEAYRRCYRYLAGYGLTEETRQELAEPYLRKAAMEKYAQKLLRSLPDGNGFSAEPALMRSVGMQGQVLFDTYFASAEQIFLVQDCHGAAWYLMEALYKEAAQRGMSLLVSKDPLLPERVDGIFLRESGYAFVVGDHSECRYPCRVLSLRRFVQISSMSEVRGRLRFAERLRESMLSGALEELENVKELHFQIEQFYVQAMDFAAKEAFTDRFCKQLFG